MVNTFDADFSIKQLIINNINAKISKIVLTMLTMIFRLWLRVNYTKDIQGVVPFQFMCYFAA